MLQSSVSPSKRAAIARHLESTHCLWRVVFTLALVLMLGGQTVFAIDIVTRRSSKNRVAGEIIEATKTELVIKPKTGDAVRVPVTDIVSIEWGDVPAVMGLAMTEELNGRFDAALTKYGETQAAIGADASKLLRPELEFLIARTKARQGLANPEQTTAGVEAISKWLDANPTSFRYYEAVTWLGRLYLSQRDFNKAKAQFNLVQAAALPELKNSAQAYSAEVQLAEGDVAGALATYESVLAQAGDSEELQQQRRLARLGKAECLSRQGNTQGALDELESLSGEIPTSEADLLTRVHLRRGDALLQLGRREEAAISYLMVDILFPSQSNARAEALYQLFRLWPELGHPERAQDAAATLTTTFKNSVWAAKLGQASP